MNKSILTLSVIVMALMAVSCKNDKPDEPDKFEGLYYEEGTSDRSYLEQVCNKVLSYIKPSDQREAITSLHSFVDYCEKYTFPDNFYDDTYIASASRELADALDSYDFLSLSRAATTFTYNLSRFKGMYQAVPNSDYWQFIEKRDDVVFKYWVGSKEYNILVAGSGGTWTETYTVDGKTYMFEIPKILDLSLFTGPLVNRNTLITVKLQTDGKDGSFLNVTSSVRFGNIQIDSTTKANNNNINEDMIMYVHNTSTLYRTVLLSSTAQISGSDLCAISSWRKAVNADNVLKSMFLSGSSTLMLYNSIQIKTQLTNLSSFIDNVDHWWSTGDTSNPKAQAERSADILSKAITAELRYSSDNNNKVRGTLGWEAYQSDSWDSYEEWGVRPTVTFLSDGGAFAFDTYFGNGRFLSVENTYRSLVNSYKSFWK